MIDTCPRCGAEDVECHSYHRGTNYINPILNQGYACEECIEEDAEIVKEMNANFKSYRGY